MDDSFFDLDYVFADGNNFIFQSSVCEKDNRISFTNTFQANQVKAYEVEAKAANLNSNDTFLVTKAGDGPFGYETSAYAWLGKGGSDREKEALQEMFHENFLTRISNFCEPFDRNQLKKFQLKTQKTLKKVMKMTTSGIYSEVKMNISPYHEPM